MGYSILELVLRLLREDGYAATAAYPGQLFPQITDLVAAAHIEKVDRNNLTVVIEVNLICPASTGGTACELEALRVIELLGNSGAQCVQSACSYDGVAQVYMVPILATFTGITEENRCVIWPGFYCYVDNRLHRYAVEFTAEQTTAQEAQYVMGQELPVGIRTGSSVWEIQLEEQIPAGRLEAEETEGEFDVKIISEYSTEVFSGCRWTSVRRERNKQGLRRLRKGYAAAREVT